MGKWFIRAGYEDYYLRRHGVQSMIKDGGSIVGELPQVREIDGFRYRYVMVDGVSVLVPDEYIVDNKGNMP